jgi:hypothetical protein
VFTALKAATWYWNDNMSVPIVFLTYMSRSGSTFLSSKLNEYKSIGVSIEGRFPEEWISGEKEIITDEKELDAYLDRLYEVPKFQAWTIDRSELVKYLLQNGFPLRYRDVLYACFDRYFEKRLVELYLYKAGHLYLYMDYLVTQFPDALFIFVDRNPLAILNSQLKSVDSRTKLPMCSDPVDFVLNYTEVQNILKAHESRNYLHVVRYEGLLEDEDAEMKRLMDFIRLKDRKKEAVGVYYDSIPDPQKHLHQNVKSGSMKLARIDAWKDELKPGHRLYLQFVLRNFLRQKGYTEPINGIMSFREMLRFIVNMSRHIYVKIRGFKPQH